MSYAAGSGAGSEPAASGSSTGARAAASGAAAASGSSGGAATAGVSALMAMTVPHSCIESAETILRTLHNPTYKFTQGGQESSAAAPPMFLWLRNGVNAFSINVSDSTSKETFAAAHHKNSYFAEGHKLNKLSLGQGICFMRASGSGGNYDMHFMALVAIKGDEVILSNVSEPKNWDQLMQVSLAKNLLTVKTVAQARAAFGATFAKPAEFACGAISLSGTTPP